MSNKIKVDKALINKFVDQYKNHGLFPSLEKPSTHSDVLEKINNTSVRSIKDAIGDQPVLPTPWFQAFAQWGKAFGSAIEEFEQETDVESSTISPEF